MAKSVPWEVILGIEKEKNTLIYLNVYSFKSSSLLSAPLRSLCFPYPELEGGDKCDLN